MANRMFNQFQGSLEKGVVQLYAEIAYDGTGATLINGKGIASVAVSSGFTLITLQDQYVKVLNASCIIKRQDTNPSNVVFATFREDVGQITNYVRIRTANISNANTTPDAGTFLYVTITLSNSTAI